MKIAVGSKNPVKIRAVRNVVCKLYPHVEIITSEVPSGVSEQPIGDDETRRGAVNRARAARRVARADWGVGLEGGAIETEFGMMTNAWCAVVDRAGHVGIGGSANMLLPESVAARVRAGVELGYAMDEFARIEDVKHKLGAIGVLTKGMSDRRRAYEFIVTLALARFLSKDAYKRKGAKP